MANSPSPVPLFSTPPAAQSMLPTEINLRIFDTLMYGYSTKDEQGPINTNFASWGAACSSFRAIAKGNGHRAVFDSEGLVDTLLTIRRWSLE